MSSCYTNLNLELIKPFSPCSNSSSSTNSPRSILTRKSRTPRKRPNQTYNEAAAILATAYPKIFPLQKTPLKSTNSLLQNRSPPDDLLPVLQVAKTESRGLSSLKAWEVETRVYNYSEKTCDGDDDFSTESLLDEEIEEGIESIFIGMKENKNDAVCDNWWEMLMQQDTCCNLEVRAMRHVDEGDWWRFPCVDVAQITQPNSAGLRLKLDYDAVLEAWSGKASPFVGNHVQVRLAQTDLFPEAEKGAGAVYEKRCARLFCKKPKYQITKLNAPHQRPRLKGRFVKTANPIDDD